MSACAFDGALFDKDGTLFDFARSWRRAADAALAAVAPEDAALRAGLGATVGYDVVGGRFTPGSPAVAGTARDVAAIWAPLLGRRDVAALAAEIDAHGVDAAADMAPAVDDLPGFLDVLRARDLALGVATHDSEAGARAHLTGVGALDRFDFIAGHDSGHGLKPGPGMVRAFCDAVGVAASRVVMVGDSVHDLGAARAAGAVAVGVLTGPASEAALAPLAAAVLPSIADLPAWLDAQAGEAA